MDILKAIAKPLIDDYIAHGDQIHFDYDSARIKGFLFTRKEIMRLLDSSKHLFAMWALSTDSSPTPKKHLNLILIGVVTDNSHLGRGTLNTDKLEITAKPIYNGSLKLPSGRVIKSTKSTESNQGERPLPKVLEAMIRDFKTATNNHLRDKNGEIIKGYHIEEIDLIDLTLRTPLTLSNEMDEFIFTPVIRKDKLPELTFESPFVSLAITRYHQGELMGYTREYCLPCPTACPTGYQM